MSYPSERNHTESLLGVYYTYKTVYLKELTDKFMKDRNLITKCTHWKLMKINYLHRLFLLFEKETPIHV